MKRDVINIFAILCLCTALIACGKKKEALRPAGVIDENRMVNVLTEIHLAEASIQINSLGLTDSSRRIATGYYKYILTKNKITKTQFDSSFYYYTRHPKLLTALYDSVLARLSQQKERSGNALPLSPKKFN